MYVAFDTAVIGQAFRECDSVADFRETSSYTNRVECFTFDGGLGFLAPSFDLGRDRRLTVYGVFSCG